MSNQPTVTSHVAGKPVDRDGPGVLLREPASDALLAEIVLATSDDLEAAVTAARSAFDGKWGKTNPAQRSRLLHKFADLIERDCDTLAEMESRNIGKAIREVSAEVSQASEILRFYASIAGQDPGGARRLNGSVLHYSVSVPTGVCAQIVPWNYPLMMAVWKLAPALAAGCTVVLKPDPLTPLTTVRLAELAGEAGFPPGVVNVLIGDGPTLGAQLVTHPGVDKVAFTGSTKTGAEIMRLAGSPVKRVSLELGGKSPNLIFADANLDDAIPAAVWSIMGSAGQSCEARSRLFVQREVCDEVVSRLVERTRRLKVSDPLDPNTEVGSLISRDHRYKVHAHVERALTDGGELLTGGFIPNGPGAFYTPTVVAGLDNTSVLGQEEVFGPVLLVAPFDDEDDAVRLANDTRYGLMASVWTNDPARAHRVANRIMAGTISINHPYTSFPGVPFGGFKQSGFGRELGHRTLELYSEVRSVLTWVGSRPSSPFEP
ncbi:MAG: aldehyde dehydrogenase [Comamonadaceae bacterium]|nr:MAG: aldehyde dehydrogenase [Comamonadaceae bacterium]